MKIVADLHTHTSVSHHAYSTLEEMCAGAKRAGHIAIAITDHGPAMDDGANSWHFGNRHVLPKRIDGVYLLFGVELNILPNGGIDLIPVKYLAELDVVIASLHEGSFPPSGSFEHTQALYNILQNPLVSVMGHLGNPNYDFDKEFIISRCKRCGKAVEINGNSGNAREGSKGNCIEIARLCQKHKVPVFINSDAHSSYGIGEVGDAVEIVKIAGLSEDLILNIDEQRLRRYFLDHKSIDILN